ncbi:MAG: hypothetical protein J2P45_17395, partial [Candidatus Dormibacteraeota bacterium]|nr:hypothetical protein [Candidatus Dormibacteraeota bacterium]
MRVGTCIRSGRRLAVAAAGAVALSLVAVAGAGAAGPDAEAGGMAGAASPGQGSGTAPRGMAPAFMLDHGHFVRFEVPGSSLTFAIGLNNREQVVGYYDDAAGATHGFLRDQRGRITTIDVPGALNSENFAINDQGQIVGTYSVQPSPPGSPGTFGPQIGFLRDARGKFTTLRFPGSIYTEAHDINNLGQVVGEWGDTAGGIHGFRWDKGRFTSIDVPGSALATATGINDRGQIV